MSHNNFLQTTTILEPTAGDIWIGQVSNTIVQPIFTLILTCLIFLGFVYRPYSKKINAAGIIATLSSLILFLGFLIQGNVNIHSISILSIGVVLVVIELFVVGVVTGIIDMILITISTTTPGDNLLFMFVSAIIALILTIVGWVISVRILNRKIPLLDKVILKDLTNPESSYNFHDNRPHPVGKTAQTVTDPRPAGIILCENERVDTVLDGNFILRNRTVKIFEVEGTRVVVKEADQLRGAISCLV